MRCKLKHRSHDHCLEGRSDKCPHCGDMLAESVVPRPMSTFPEISGMITFPDQHLTSREVKKSEKLKVSKIIKLCGIEISVVELLSVDSPWYFLQLGKD